MSNSAGNEGLGPELVFLTGVTGHVEIEGAEGASEPADRCVPQVPAW